MSIGKLQKAVSQAYSNGPVRNFMNAKEAKGLIATAKADGKVSGAERKLLEQQLLGWSYYSDDARPTKPLSRRTVSMDAGVALNTFLHGTKPV
jgi:hypothetical protein